MSRSPNLIAAFGGAALLALGGVLWARYGGSVFLDMVTGGLIGCLF